MVVVKLNGGLYVEERKCPHHPAQISTPMNQEHEHKTDTRNFNKNKEGSGLK